MPQIVHGNLRRALYVNRMLFESNKSERFDRRCLATFLRRKQQVVFDFSLTTIFDFNVKSMQSIMLHRMWSL